MSSNISGFQGVNTPLQSMTNGKYTLADYTKMNTLFGARITALEKAVAFNPNNVTISGYVNVQPNASNSGTLTTAGAAQIGGNLQVAKALTVTQNAFIGGSLQVSGALSFASLAVNTFTSNTITNSGLTISNTFSGNGALLTGVLDGTKLPLAGGTITGNLNVNGYTTINGQFTSDSNVTASDRQISSSYFNFQGTNNVPGYIGRLYASTGGLVLDFSSNPNGNFVFYTNDGVNITNPLTITPTSVNVTGALNMGPYNINSTGAITGLNFYGNASGLTNISVINTTTVASGPTYFPLFTLNGSTSTNAVPYSSLNLSYLASTNTLTVPNLSSYGVISGDGSGLTNIANAATATNVAYSGLTGTVPTWNQSTSGNAATASSVPYSGLTGTVPTWNQNTTGNAATATTATTATNSGNITAGAAGQMLYQSGASATSFTATGVAGQVLTSQGAGTPTWTVPSVGLPLTGGTMTGDISFTSATSAAKNYKRDLYVEIDNNSPNMTFIPLTNSYSVHDYLEIINSNTVTINLQQFIPPAVLYQDKMRRVTITKTTMASGDYVCSLLPPNSYFFYTPSQNGVASSSLPIGVFSATYLISQNGGNKIILESLVKL